MGGDQGSILYGLARAVSRGEADVVISADIAGRDAQGLSPGERQAVQETAQSFGSILVLARPDDRLREIQDRAGTTPARTTLVALAADRDAGARQIQHFVVDRGVAPEAFSDSRAGEADSAWERLLASHGARSSEELNERHKRGLTPYSVDLKPKSETFGALKDRGRLVHAGIALRDVIAVPIHIEQEDPTWDPGVVTVSTSAESVADALGARLGRRVELSDASASQDAIGATAYTPALFDEDAPGGALEVLLSSWEDLRSLREIVWRLRTLRTQLAGASSRGSTLGELRSIALGSGMGMIAP